MRSAETGCRRTAHLQPTQHILCVTVLDTDVVSFAYSSALPYYLELRSSLHIKDHMFDLRLTTDTLQHINVSSCILSLFLNVQQQILDYCTFTLRPYGLKPSVMALDSSTILFTNVSGITRSCAGLPDVHLPGCTQCIYRLPCKCTFATDRVYVPPTLTKCGPVLSNRTQRPITHVTNLAVLSHFFSENDLASLASNTLLRHPIDASLPDFLLYDHNYSNALAAIDRTKFQLSKAANLSMKRKIAYRSMAEYLSHKHSIMA